MSGARKNLEKNQEIKQYMSSDPREEVDVKLLDYAEKRLKAIRHREAEKLSKDELHNRKHTHVDITAGEIGGLLPSEEQEKHMLEGFLEANNIATSNKNTAKKAIIEQTSSKNQELSLDRLKASAQIDLGEHGLHFDHVSNEISNHYGISQGYTVEFSNILKKIQIESHLPATGELNFETYSAFIAINFLDKHVEKTDNVVVKEFYSALNNKETGITADLLTKVSTEIEQLQNIVITSPEPGMAVGDIVSLNILVRRYKQQPGVNAQHQEILDGIHTQQHKFLENASVQNEVNKPQNKTILEDVMELGPVEGLKKHKGAALLIGSLAFLFGAFKGVHGSKMGLGSFWGRLLWFVGGAYAGVDKVFGKGVDYISDNASDWGKSAQKAKEKASKATKKYISEMTRPKWVDDLTSSVSGGATDMSEKLTESYKQTLGNIATKNEVNKTGDNKDTYVNDIETISVLTSDKVFTGSKIEDLEAVKGDVDGIKSFMSDPVKTKIFPDSLTGEDRKSREKDLKNYIDLILSEKDNDSTYVREIFIENKLWKSITDSLQSNAGGYIQNTVLNEKIKTSIGSIDNDEVQGEMINGLSNMTHLGINNQESYDFLTNYLSSSDGITENDKKNIQDISDIFLSEIALVKGLKKLDSDEIQLENPQIANDSLETIDDKLGKLKKIKDEFEADTTRLPNSDNSQFIEKYNTLKLALHKKGAELENNPEGDNTKKLAQNEKQVEIDANTREVNELEKSISKVPKDGENLGIYSQYLKDNKESFQTAQKLLSKYNDAGEGTPEEELKKKLEVILEGMVDVKGYIETYQKNLNNDIKTLQDKVVKILPANSKLDLVQFGQKKQELSNTVTEYKKIYDRLYTPYADFWNLQINAGESELSNIQNTLIFIGGSHTVNITSEDKIAMLRDKINTTNTSINSSLEVKIDLDGDINVLTDISKISSFINKIKEFDTGIADMTQLKGVKLDTLKDEVDTLVQLYVTQIKNTQDPTELETIKSNYNTQVYDQIGSVLNMLGGGLIENHNDIEEAYKNKSKELKEDQIEAKENEKLQNLEIDKQMTTKILEGIGFDSEDRALAILNDDTTQFPINGYVIVHYLETFLHDDTYNKKTKDNIRSMIVHIENQAKK